MSPTDYVPEGVFVTCPKCGFHTVVFWFDLDRGPWTCANTKCGETITKRPATINEKRARLGKPPFF